MPVKCSSKTWSLAEVEGTGRLDIIYRSLLGQIYIQNFGSTNTHLVSWATHRGNMRRDGNRGVSLYPPGTPLVTQRICGFNRTSFTWSNTNPAMCYRIYRADHAAGPFQHIATVTADTATYTDSELKPGWQYFYEVGAVYGSNTVHSAPFAILSFLNSNLVANAGFERNDNCRWDKWFTGSLEMTNMTASTNIAYQGRQSMQIVLQNQGNKSAIAQYNQYGIPDSTIYVTPGALYSFGAWFMSPGISQPSEHWLEWSSTKTGNDTNTRPALPYPFYYTPHFAIGTAPADWTYVNRTFQLPAGFPNVELRHRYTIAAPGSGSIYLDNVFFRQLPSPTVANWTALVNFGSAWRYSITMPPASWTAPNFNDTAWLLANAKFGAGSGPTNIVTRLPKLLPAYFFRKQFVVPSVTIEELLLSATCTDVSANSTLRLFLNGTEVKAFIDAVTLQGNEIRYCDLTPFASLLQPGTNTIAVQLGNTWSDYDDVAFDLSLKAVSSQTQFPSLTLQCSPGNPPAVCAQAPVGTVWQIQSCDLLAPTGWQLMQTFTNSGGSMQTFQDTGQNGRKPPASVTARFYRMLPY